MERHYRVLYGHKGSRETLYIDFVSTAENAQIVAIAIGKGQHATWCAYVDTENGKEEMLWDCIFWD